MDPRKWCFDCKSSLPRALFGRNRSTNDGLNQICKQCSSARCRARYAQNRERQLAGQKEWRAKNPGYAREHSRIQRDRDPLAYAAHKIVRTATRNGTLVPPDRCQRCGDPVARLHSHHADYAKPLEVEWICPQCHRTEHGRHAKAASPQLELGRTA